MHNNPPLARAEDCALDTIEEAYRVRMTDFFWLAHSLTYEAAVKQ